MTRSAVAFLCLAPVFFMAGCSARRFAATGQIRDSVTLVREVDYIERLRDTVVYVTLPAESRGAVVRADSSFLETSLAFSTARVGGDGTLRHTLENKPQLPKPVPVTLREKDRTTWELKQTESRTVIEVPVRLPLSGWDRFLKSSGLVFWGMAVAGAVALLAKFLIR